MSWLDNLPMEPVNKLLNPIADSLGQGIGGIFYWIFQKPIQFKVNKEAEVQDLANKTAERLQKIPEKNRDTSNRGLLMKTIEEAQYSISEDDLRTMFANLIASSADNRKNNLISPRFPTILSQLSGEDARLLQTIHNQPSFQLPLGFLELQFNDVNKGSRRLSTYLSLTSDNHILSSIDANLDTLSSLGIIKVLDNTWLTASHYLKQYDLIEDLLLNTQKISKINMDGTVELNKGILRTTDFGINFLNCVL